MAEVAGFEQGLQEQVQEVAVLVEAEADDAGVDVFEPLEGGAAMGAEPSFQLLHCVGEKGLRCQHSGFQGTGHLPPAAPGKKHGGEGPRRSADRQRSSQRPAQACLPARLPPCRVSRAMDAPRLPQVLHPYNFFNIITFSLKTVICLFFRSI